MVEADIYYGAIFENEKRIEYNKEMIEDMPNKLKEINPNLDEEIYKIVHVFDFEDDIAEFYHNMKEDESMLIIKRNI